LVTRSFTVVLEAAEEGGFIVKCLELPVPTQGETREESLRNIREAVKGYLEVKAELLGKHGLRFNPRDFQPVKMFVE